MPNIEMYGFDEGDLRARYRELQAAFKDAPYAEDTVITGIRSGAYSLESERDKRPFFRVYGTKNYLEKHLSDIKERLKPLQVDVEVLVLTEFILKTP